MKGAYWDSEIKRAQERGLADYPVFTRKAMTDANYLACARLMLASDRLYPQFATHNALTVAAVITEAGARENFEFQRLHGMGEALAAAAFERSRIPWRVYAPVGPHRDLLAYLVRRLIENGANSSFVARAADPLTPESTLIADPYALIGAPEHARNQRIVAPAELYSPLRANSAGVEFGDSAALSALRGEIDTARERHIAAIPSQATTIKPRACVSPIDGATIGEVAEADAGAVDAAMEAARTGFRDWSATSVETRARAIERAADLIEARRGSLIALLQGEAGKTLDDALAEIREAADLCRYYARQAREICRETALPGPTGEENALRRIGRGVFVCISPWNFPLAIFIGQIAAALAAGNSVAAKPAEQTPLVAFEAVKLLIEAGVPRAALQLLPGGGEVGAALVAHPACAGVVFTGSLEVARTINRALAEKPGLIVPLIAETGGVNAMIVNSTALLEQVADDVTTSAFRSAGQRCSALRLLCVQEDIARPCLALIEGAARELRLGDPRNIATHIGPVIDAEAKARLEAYLARRAREGRVIYNGAALDKGVYVAPHIVRTRPCPRSRRGDLWARAACRDLARGGFRRVDRADRGHGLRSHAWAGDAHRTTPARTRGKGAGGQYLRQSQHDRRRRRRPAVRRLWPLRHGAEGRWTRLSSPVHARSHAEREHGRGGRRRRLDGDGGIGRRAATPKVAFAGASCHINAPPHDEIEENRYAQTGLDRDPARAFGVRAGVGPRHSRTARGL